MNKKEYKLDDSVGYKLFQATRLITNRLNKRYKEKQFPITHEQWQILSRLYEKDGQTQQELAVMNEKDEPSVSRLIANMIKRGLVQRKVHSKDRRVNIICLTEESKRLESDYTFIAQQTVIDAAEGIDEKEFAICLRVLDQIRQNLK